MHSKKARQTWLPGLAPTKQEELDQVNLELNRIGDRVQASSFDFTDGFFNQRGGTDRRGVTDERGMEFFISASTLYVTLIAPHHPLCSALKGSQKLSDEFRRIVLQDPGSVLSELSNSLGRNSLYIPAVVPTLTSIMHTSNVTAEERGAFLQSLRVFMNVVGAGSVTPIPRANYQALRKHGFADPVLAKTFANDIQLYFDLTHDARE